MLGCSVKTNLKTILRDPATLLAILAGIIMEFMYGINVSQYDLSYNTFGKEYYYTEAAFTSILNSMINLVSGPITTIVFMFMGVVLAINLFKDIRMQTYDILTSSGLRFGQYYIAKLISYYIIALGLSFGLTVLHSVLFAVFYLPPDPNFNVGKVLIAGFVMMIALYTSVLLHTFAYALFIVSLTGIAVSGVLFNAVYPFLPYMFTIFAHQTVYSWYIHATPEVMLWYFKYWITHPKEEWFARHMHCGTAVTNYFWADIYEVGLSYGLITLITAALIFSSYFLLKRRFQKA